ncbi:MAG TPA: ABC transporter ATP-binding protein [Methylomirabilota bacterium]|nr:ABC transporter ATP-binding protein [Methylomirabilota bacterium]
MTEHRRPAGEPLLELQQVRISYFTRAGEVNVIPGLSLSIGRGEALGLVGESGCGKSTVALAIVRYLGRAGRIIGGRILFEGRDLGALPEAELRGIRGRRIAMVYQDPMSSLNPVMTVGRQLMEVPLIHEGVGGDEARARALRMLTEVNLPDPEGILERYPHQLSGGQQQRIVIAMALIARPALLILDEPTTGLDVTVEAAVLDLVRGLRMRHDTAILYISHNLGTVVRVCDRVGVMYRGELVEEGSIRQVFGNPRHPYTRGLLDCLPAVGRDKRRAPLLAIPGQMDSLLARLPGCGFAARCAHVEPGRCTVGVIPTEPVADEPGHEVQCVRAAELPLWRRRYLEAGEAGPQAAADLVLALDGLSKVYRPRRGLFGTRADVRALTDVWLDAHHGQTLAIVGESGCGKSTLARVLAGLETATAGRASLAGADIAAMPVDARPAGLRRQLQMVFQNPDSTLNPSHTVGYAIGRALRRLRRLGAADRAREVGRLLEVVRLGPELAGWRPHRLSGGQKQRVAIARALAGDPEVIVADEPVSSLDVSVQAAIINLLTELQAKHGTTLLVISHDLSVVRYLADAVAVMYLGRVVEFGRAEDVFAPPYHPYTEALLSAVPIPDPDAQRDPIVLEGALPSPSEVPRGCPFSSRCPRKLGVVCEDTPPPEQRLAGGHRIVCHIPADELVRLQRPDAAVPRPGLVQEAPA